MQLSFCIALCFFLLANTHLPAQDGGTVPENRVIWVKEIPATLVMKDGALSKDYDTKSYGPIQAYQRNGREYRRLSGQETAQFDAIPKVEVRHGKLYYDGRKIRTDSMSVYRVHFAHHWNGGVAVFADTSKGFFSNFPYMVSRAGFIDLRIGVCRFSVDLPFNMFWGLGPYSQTFLVPVTIDASNKDLGLYVRLPESVYINEKYDLAFSLANNSERPVSAPDSMVEGLGVLPYFKPRRPPWEEMPQWSTRKDSEPSAIAVSSPLGSGEARVATVPINVREMCYNNLGRYRMAFHWDGFLDPDDRGRMSRFFCERWVDIVEPEVDTACKDLALEVEGPPGKVSWAGGGNIEVTVRLTNKSDRTILVPDDLGDGLGSVLRLWYKPDRKGKHFDTLSARKVGKLLASGAELSYQPRQMKHPVLRVPYAAHCSPLAPGATREAKILVHAADLLSTPGRHPVAFHWDGLLDPDDRGRVSRLTAEDVWVKSVESLPDHTKFR